MKGVHLSGLPLVLLACAAPEAGKPVPRVAPDLGLLAPVAVFEGPSPRASALDLDLIRGLSGTWTTLDAEGQLTDEITHVFRVIAGGSAVAEEIFPGTPHEMLSVYQKGPRGLQMVHYCAARNAPLMFLAADSTAASLHFICEGGLGLEDHGTGHMHEGRIHFLGENRLRSEWTFYQSGVPAEETAVFELVRLTP